MDIDAALSSSSGEDGANLASGAGRGGKRQSRLKPKHSSETPEPQDDGRYQPHDTVEARFGGRSKWFPGKVRRAYEGREGRLLYDVDFDDGDEEEGVLAGRVRRPGQGPPALRAGLVVDVKLARKGKGYHPGTIGRVNDDGSLYVKLDDGDSEWSLPAQQAIPIYPYTPSVGGTNTGASDGQVEARAARDENSRAEPHDDADDQLGPNSTSPRAAENDQPASSDRSNNTRGHQASAASTASGPLPLSSSSSFDGGAEKQSSQNNDQNGGAEEKSDQSGSGISWIADLAKSVETPTPAAQLPDPAARTDAGGKRSEAGDDSGNRGGGGGGSGLDWITELVSPLAQPSARESSSSGGEASAERGPPVATGNLSPVPITQTPAVAPDRGPSTPVATKSRPPRAVTPSHLEWKPITDGSAKRRWGAPPPEVDADKSKGGEETKTQQRQQLPNSPPRLSRSTAAPDSTRSLSTDAAPLADAPASRSATRVSAPKIALPAGQQEPKAKTNVGGESNASIASTDTIASQGARSGGRPPTVPVAGGRTPGPEVRERDDANTQHSCDASGGATAENLGGSQDNQGTEMHATQQEGAASFESSGSVNATVPLPGGGAQIALPSVQKKGVAEGQSVRGGSSRWDIIRSSVQRRYAAEAMHLSEEVRLLTAKLAAAEDKTQARLVQQERKLVRQMDEVLKRERDKMQALLSEERASSARRINTLKGEVDAARRQLELERRRSEKAASTGGQAILSGRRAKTSPPLHHTTGSVRGREKTRGTVSSYEPAHCEAPDRSASTVRRPRSSSSARVSRTGPWGLSDRDAGRRCPPPPPLSLATTCPDSGRKASSAASASEGARRTIFSERLGHTSSSVLSPLSCGGSGGGGSDGKGVEYLALENILRNVLATVAEPSSSSKEESSFHNRKRDGEQEERSGSEGEAFEELAPPPPRQRERAPAHRERAVSDGHREQASRWRLETERRDTRRRLEAMKGEVERVVGQFRARAERAEAAAASAEQRAKVKALRYLRSKRSPPTTAGFD
ncbi:conserved unknown protein [Ectocarpus siliculosus]|uniref:Tudor domain-containing protein n=1 Tax=Ectocarpus siliculosus TaxID=2880 RepID=D7FWC4_ECTSI|nr:conserved unknown protein [Ectocarpus siliculosus]|eukprot:CBJ32012.1 conserved unknown protein [Ectocarpus siliculosus]